MYTEHTDQQLIEIQKRAETVVNYIVALRRKRLLSGKETILAETGTVNLFLKKVVKWVNKQIEKEQKMEAEALEEAETKRAIAEAKAKRKEGSGPIRIEKE